MRCLAAWRWCGDPPLRRAVGCDGELMTTASADGPAVITAELDPAVARAKRLIKVPGKYELDRVGHRRPEMYAVLAEPRGSANHGD